MILLLAACFSVLAISQQVSCELPVVHEAKKAKSIDSCRSLIRNETKKLENLADSCKPFTEGKKNKTTGSWEPFTDEELKEIKRVVAELESKHGDMKKQEFDEESLKCFGLVESSDPHKKLFESLFRDFSRKKVSSIDPDMIENLVRLIDDCAMSSNLSSLKCSFDSLGVSNLLRLECRMALHDPYFWTSDLLSGKKPNIFSSSKIDEIEIEKFAKALKYYADGYEINSENEFKRAILLTRAERELDEEIKRLREEEDSWLKEMEDSKREAERSARAQQDSARAQQDLKNLVEARERMKRRIGSYCLTFAGAFVGILVAVRTATANKGL